MLRTPLWAAASLLALAVTLTGCDNAPAPEDVEQPRPTTQPTSSTARLTVQEEAAQAVVNHYADLALAIFTDAQTSAEQLKSAIQALLSKPTAEHLKAAQQAWINARIPYMQAEAFRFGNPVVDEWETQINAWPLDEGLIDYVSPTYQQAVGNPVAKANIIANSSIQVNGESIDLKTLTPDTLAGLNQLAGFESNVATGYHALEFLLWGERPSNQSMGAGKRPATDYAEGKACTGGHCERRRAYLQAATDLLVRDLSDMVLQWQADIPDNYRAEFVSEPPLNALRKMLFGMGSLAQGELASIRLKAPLESHLAEDEHDSFSNNTHNGLFYNVKGIRNLYTGEYRQMDGSLVTGPSLSALVQSVAPEADAAVQHTLADTESKFQTLVERANKGVTFNQLVAPNNTEGHHLIHQAIGALTQQTQSLEQAAEALGVQDLNPEGSDYNL